MPRLPRWARFVAGIAALAAVTAATVALFDRDWLGAFLLTDFAVLAGLGAWLGRDLVAPDES